jgi:hypothetical protein
MKCLLCGLPKAAMAHDKNQMPMLWHPFVDKPRKRNEDTRTDAERMAFAEQQWIRYGEDPR